jgi:hypothetical protein
VSKNFKWQTNSCQGNIAIIFLILHTKLIQAMTKLGKQNYPNTQP